MTDVLPVQQDRKKRGGRRRRRQKISPKPGGVAPGDTKTDPTPHPVAGANYPLGKRLRAVECEASKQHCHRDSVTGENISGYFNSNAGCTTRGNECPPGLRRRMKQSGLHRPIGDPISRRGGFHGANVLPAAEIDGFAKSLRDTEQLNVSSRRDLNPPNDQQTGGYLLPLPTSISNSADKTHLGQEDSHLYSPFPTPGPDAAP